MSIKKICLLALFSAILIGAKFAFQSIPFVEIVTLLFAVFGMTLKYRENWIIFIVFWLTNLAINGFGLYWIPYFVFFPITFTITYAIKNSKHNILLASVACINTGFLIFATYFLYDFLLFDLSYAIAAGINAFWFNFVEGLINAVAMIIIGVPLIKVIHYIQRRLFHEEFKKKRSITGYIPSKKSSFIYLTLSSVFFLGLVSIIPIYLFTDTGENAKNIIPPPSTTRVRLESGCIIEIKYKAKEVQEKFEDCGTEITFLGKAIDELNNNREWEIKFIEDNAADFNGDGIKERFIGGAKNIEKNFDSTGRCPTIFVNDKPSIVGSDTLPFAEKNYYTLDYDKGSC